MLRAVVFAVALACVSIVALAQPAQPDKKGDAAKGKEEPKVKGKPKVPLDKANLPKDALIVLIEDILGAAQIYPKSVVLSYEEYQELREKLKAYERQLKNDKKTPTSCKLLDGRLEGDFLTFRAEYGFSTELPKTSVVLGLKGGHLTEEGDLDGKPAVLDYSDEEGFIARVEKEGDHKLTLKFRVPVQLKKSTAGSIERGSEFGLPGAPTTIVDLQLPDTVDELRWNETVEKTKTPGRWVFGVDKSKPSLTLAWRQHAPIQGKTPLPKAEGQINVRVDATHVNVSAEIFLDDIRPFKKEWQLVLPLQAKVTEVKAPSGPTDAWTNPEPGLWKITKMSPEKWQVSVTQRVPRPGPGARVPIGPFQVLGAFQHHGTITVQMPADVSYGQRLEYTRSGDTYQVKNAETEATFQYLAPPAPNVKAAKANKAPLELELRNVINQLETHVEHTLKLHTAQQGWELDATTRIQVKALFSAFNAVELKLPMPRPRGLSVLGTLAPSEGFPAGLPWGGIWKTFGTPWTVGGDEEITILDENGNPLKLVPLDATGKTRVIAERAPAKQMTLVLKNTIKIPARNQRIRLELPKPLNTIDRGAKVSMQTDDRMELLFGPEDAEEPVPERHRFELRLNQAPAAVDVAWRPFEREIVAQATLDVTLFEHSAHVRQRLQFPRERSPTGIEPKDAQVMLKLPPGVDKVRMIDGAEITHQDKKTLWLKAKDDRAERIEVVLEYDLSVIKKSGADAAAPRTLGVTPLWPGHVSQKDVKVRVWCPNGVQARLTEDLTTRGLWKERSIELVKDKDQFPALVLQGYGADLPLTLKLEESAAAPVAAFLADRALLQVRMGDDDTQQVQARYWIRKIQAPHVDVELPLPASRLRDLHFMIGKFPIFAAKQDAGERVVRLPLHPEQITLPAVLEIRYTIPADGMERNYLWKTTLFAPSFRSDAVIREMRWQLSMPTPMLAASLNRKARSEHQWGLHNWLWTPEPAVTSNALDAWLTGAEATQAEEHVTYAFALNSTQTEAIYHLPRAWWLLGCSGLLLIVALGAYFAPLPRAAFWMLLLMVGVGLLTLEIVCPAALPPILFGMQPGVILIFVVIGVYWILQERHRRQLVFLPGFTRTKPASTVLRAGSSKRPRETSTLEAPPPDAEATATNPPAAT